MPPNSTYEYLIKIIADTRGSAVAQQEADKLAKSFEKTGISAASLNNVISTRSVTSFNALGQAVTGAAITFRDGDKISTAYIKNLNNLSNVNRVVSTTTIGLSENLRRLTERALLTIPVWIALRGVIMGLITALTMGVKSWSEIESAMAQISVVANYTDEQLSDLKNTILAYSVALGASAKDSLEAAKLFAQQGLSLAETVEMTRTAMVGSVLLGDTVSSTVESLTAATRAYNITAEDSIKIIDKWQAVQKGFAVTSKDLAEAMKTAGAAAAALGISQEDFLGHVTAIIETTRKTGSQAANALQAVYSRLFTAAREAVQTIGKVPVFEGLNGEATFANTNKFRDASLIINELAQSWKNLSESQKIQLASELGSRRQLTPTIALFESYSRALEASKSAQDSAGLAMEDFGIVSETFEVKIKSLESAWISFSNTLEQTGTLKTVIDTLTVFILAITVLIRKLEEFSKNNPISSNIAKSIFPGSPLGSLFSTENLKDAKKMYTDMLADMNQSIEGASKAKSPSPFTDANAEDMENRVAQAYATELRSLNQRLELAKAYGLSELSVLLYKEQEIKANATLYESEKGRILIEEAHNDILVERQKLLQEQVNIIEKDLASAIEGLLSGKSLPDMGKQFGDALIGQFRKTVAGGVADILMASDGGGILGSIFGNIKESMGTFADRIKSAHMTVYNPIFQAHQDGAKFFRIGVSEIDNPAAGDLGPFTPFRGTPLQGVGLPGMGRGGFLRGNIGRTGVTRAAGLSAVGGSLLTGYSQYQAAGGAGGSLSMASGLMGGLGAGALGLVGMGFGQGAAIGTLAGGGTMMGAATMLGTLLPVIGIGLLAASVITSMLSKTKSTQIQEQSKDTRVSSKIDVTNKQLELVNRNLIALRSDMRTYILPESAYYSEKINLEDEFAMSAKRG